jgi:heat shock protein HspQ
LDIDSLPAKCRVQAAIDPFRPGQADGGPKSQSLEIARRVSHIMDMEKHTPKTATALYAIGDIVRHRLYPFRGVIFDVDPEFANTEEWYESIPEELRPRRDQPFYHLFAENADTEYVAYVSEQNLVPDESGEPVRHPQVPEVFEWISDAKRYLIRPGLEH